MVVVVVVVGWKVWRRGERRRDRGVLGGIFARSRWVWFGVG